MDTTTAHTFTADQAVLINLDPRRAPRTGFYVEDADAPGKVRVRYEVKGAERFADVAIAKVAAAEPVDTDGIDEAPVDEVPTVDVEVPATDVDEFGWTGDPAPAVEAPVGPVSPAVTAAAYPDLVPDAAVVVFTSWSRDHQERTESIRGTVARLSRNGYVTVRCQQGTTCDYDPRDVVALPAVAEEVPAPTEHTATVRKAAAAARPGKTPKRAPLRDGYTTPVGLAKVINERGLYTGDVEGGLTSQALYGYIKGAPTADPFPSEDHDGRNVVGIEAGVAWWVRKNDRAATRRLPAKVDRQALAAELHAALNDAADAEAAATAVRAIADRLAG